MLILTEGSFPWWTRLGLEYPELLTIALVAVFAVGSCFGSFLNVCIWRLPLGESIVSVPSHCTKCGYEIRWYDNIPIISYLVLRGRCRNCREPYSPRYLIVEALTGLLFVAVFLKVGVCPFGELCGEIFRIESFRVCFEVLLLPTRVVFEVRPSLFEFVQLHIGYDAFRSEVLEAVYDSTSFGYATSTPARSASLCSCTLYIVPT